MLQGRLNAPKQHRHRRIWRAAAFTALVTLLSVAGSRHGQDAVANGDTRTLNLVHAHTKESAQITFMRNGVYDSEALQKLNWILRDWRRDEPINMDPHLFDLVWAVYRETGSRAPITIMSGYRSPGTNAMLRRRSRAVAKHSQHMAGRAMDVHFSDVPMSKVREIGLRLQRGGVGYYPTAHSPFVHLDTGTVRHWPRVSRAYLERLFPDGKTVHIPSDGRPLAHYAEAEAEIAARGGSAIALAEVNTPRGKSFWASLFGGEDDEEEAAPRSRGGRRGQVVVAAADPQPSGDNSSALSFILQSSGNAAQPAAQPAAPVARSAPPPAAQTPAPAEPAAAAVAAAIGPTGQPLELEPPASRPADGLPIPLPPTKPVLVASLEPQATTDQGFMLANIPLPPARAAGDAPEASADMSTEVASLSAIPLPPLLPSRSFALASAVDAPPALPSAIVGTGRPLPASVTAYAAAPGVPMPPSAGRTRITTAHAPVVAQIVPVATARAVEPPALRPTFNGHDPAAYGVKLDREGLAALMSRSSLNDGKPLRARAPAPAATVASARRFDIGRASLGTSGRFSGPTIRPLGSRTAQADD